MNSYMKYLQAAFSTRGKIEQPEIGTSTESLVVPLLDEKKRTHSETSILAESSNRFTADFEIGFRFQFRYIFWSLFQINKFSYNFINLT